MAKNKQKTVFQKGLFLEGKKRFLKRFVSTRKTNSGPTSLKQKFAGKQTNKTTWKKVCFQGFQTLCGQVCFEFLGFLQTFTEKVSFGSRNFSFVLKTFVFLWKRLFPSCSSFSHKSQLMKTLVSRVKTNLFRGWTPLFHALKQTLFPENVCLNPWN